MGTFKYKAFISYSHNDRKWAQWLHKRLETYPVPKHLVGMNTLAGDVPKRLKPIFKDREELSVSHDLSSKIEKVLESSQFLIIICSPSSAKSRWVNQEILTFKRQNREAQLFALIVDGEPFMSNIERQENRECFPPALRYQLTEDGELSTIPSEPLAADIRNHADGKRLGYLKLISGLLGVNLDEIIQRDMQRTRNRVMAITSSALTTVLVMSALTWVAVGAKREAEQHRKDAEGLVGFMLTDLRDKLKPVGRLDILEDIAEHSLHYFDRQGNETLSCEGASAKARALYLQANVHMDKKEVALARTKASTALLTLRDRKNRCKTNPQFIINYAHALQWDSVTELNLNENKPTKNQSCNNGEAALSTTKKRFSSSIARYNEARDMIKRLKSHADWKTDYILEMSDADILIGEMYLNSSNCEVAYNIFKAALDRLSKKIENKQIMTDVRVIDKYADIATWLAATQEKRHFLTHALVNYDIAKKNYEEIISDEAGSIKNWNAYYASLSVDYNRARIFFKLKQNNTAIKILNSLKIQILLLTKADQENENWALLEKQIKNSLRHLENISTEGN